MVADVRQSLKTLRMQRSLSSTMVTVLLAVVFGNEKMLLQVETSF